MAILAADRQSVRAGSQDLSWREIMKHAVRDPAELCRRLDLPDEIRRAAELGARDFPLFVPEPYLRRIRPGDPSDPLLRQVLPIDDERREVAGFVTDPVGDGPAQLTPGLLQKYDGRALLVTTGACAIHCRYCFRRHFPYDETPRSIDAWAPAIAAIEADDSIDEALLSGGDPLTMIDATLGDLAYRLAHIPHLRRLRIHTRLPIVIPQRVDDSLLDWLAGTRLTPIVVVHANHPAELDDDVAAAIRRLFSAGAIVLNQSVLLRGVNDDAATLAELSRRLIDLRVTPYYLHQLDRVAGAAHFEVSIPKGLELVDSMRASLPGYAVPQYVQEVAGDRFKRPLTHAP